MPDELDRSPAAVYRRLNDWVVMNQHNQLCYDILYTHTFFRQIPNFFLHWVFSFLWGVSVYLIRILCSGSSVFKLLFHLSYSNFTSIVIVHSTSSVWTVALMPVIISCTIMDVYWNTLGRLYVTTCKVSPEFKIGWNCNITRTLTSPSRLILVK